MGDGIPCYQKKKVSKKEYNEGGEL